MSTGMETRLTLRETILVTGALSAALLLAAWMFVVA
jgi:hypothetical protein